MGECQQKWGEKCQTAIVFFVLAVTCLDMLMSFDTATEMH